MAEGCTKDGCGEPILVEDVCYDHAKMCRRCNGPSRDGLCIDTKRCDEQLKFMLAEEHPDG